MLYNKHHGNAPAGAVYIGRGSSWGNPWPIGPRYGSRNDVCDRFEAYMAEKWEAGQLDLEALAALHGKDLVCFCAPHRCHGETIQKYANLAYDKLNNDPLEI